MSVGAISKIVNIGTPASGAVEAKRAAIVGQEQSRGRALRDWTVHGVREEDRFLLTRTNSGRGGGTLAYVRYAELVHIM